MKRLIFAIAVLAWAPGCAVTEQLSMIASLGKPRSTQASSYKNDGSQNRPRNRPDIF